MQLISGLLHCSYALQKNANYARHVTGYPTVPWRYEAAVVEYTHRIGLLPNESGYLRKPVT